MRAITSPAKHLYRPISATTCQRNKPCGDGWCHPQFRPKSDISPADTVSSRVANRASQTDNRLHMWSSIHSENIWHAVWVGQLARAMHICTKVLIIICLLMKVSRASCVLSVHRHFLRIVNTRSDVLRGMCFPEHVYIHFSICHVWLRCAHDTDGR